VVERAQARGLTWQLSPDLLGALNSKGYFETSNPAWQSVLGWSEAEVASMSIFELLHPDDVEHTRAGFELTLVGQPALRFVNRYRCKNGGYRWISWVGIKEHDFVYCTGRDITAEKMAEIELATAQVALRRRVSVTPLAGT
jgi:PAS domain S-box-containing protein